MNDYQQLGQPLTQEQIDLNKAASASAQFFDKTNALGHQPAMPEWAQKATSQPPNDFGGQVYQPQRQSKPEPQFDSEAHRSFMRGLG
jgi:hypothetical protein